MQRFGKPGAVIELDVAQWPVVVLRALGQDFADEDIQRAIDAYVSELRGRPGSFATVQDLRATSGLPPRQRAMLSEGMKRNEDINRRCRGHALVITSAILRGMLTAILWLRKPEYEVAVFADLAEAIRWAQGKAQLAA